MCDWKKWGHLRPEYPDELRIHVFIVVRDIEAHNALVGQVTPELGRKLAAVSLFHDEYDLGPFNELWSQRVVGAEIGTRRRALDAWMVGEYLLGRRATKSILAADKEYVFHGRPTA